MNGVPSKLELESVVDSELQHFARFAKAEIMSVPAMFCSERTLNKGIGSAMDGLLLDIEHTLNTIRFVENNSKLYVDLAVALIRLLVCRELEILEQVPPETEQCDNAECCMPTVDEHLKAATGVAEVNVEPRAKRKYTRKQPIKAKSAKKQKLVKPIKAKAVKPSRTLKPAKKKKPAKR